MRDFLSTPIAHNALRLMAAGVLIPLIFGIAARVFVFRIDKDDARNNPQKAQQLERLGTEGPATPEPSPVFNEPWQVFSASFGNRDDLAAGQQG